MQGTGTRHDSPVVRIRRRLGLTREQLAVASGMSCRALSRIEAGEIAGVKLRRWVALASALGVAPCDLVPGMARRVKLPAQQSEKL